jgi:putative membrane protein insertion efficiency factor
VLRDKVGFYLDLPRKRGFCVRRRTDRQETREQATQDDNHVSHSQNASTAMTTSEDKGVPREYDYMDHRWSSWRSWAICSINVGQVRPKGQSDRCRHGCGCWSGWDCRVHASTTDQCHPVCNRHPNCDTPAEVLFIAMQPFLLTLIAYYQRWAPMKLRAACRFEPSCSNYALIAVNKYGAVKGTWLSLQRLIRCRPPNGGRDYP